MKQLVNIKIKAGALQYVIFISVVIALLVFAFLGLSYTQQQLKIKKSHFAEAVRNANLSVDFALKNNVPNTKLVEVTFSDKKNDKNTILKHNWGVFDMVKVTSSVQKETFTKNALIGGFIQNRPALYLKDNNQPLVVVGATKIEGNTKLPKQGVKRGTIAGNSYYGSQLIYGAVGQSATELPKLKKREYLKQLCNKQLGFFESNAFDLLANTKMSNSFSNVTKVFRANEPIVLADISLVGNFIILSDIAIEVSSSAKLTDVILIAPKIKIYNNVKGNFQAFATKNIEVGSNCLLSYPSSLVLFEKKKKVQKTFNQNSNAENNQILINKNSKIRGVVAFLSDNEQNNFKSQLILEELTTVLGEVYCNGNFELKGMVNGTVLTNSFIANQYGGVYQNHIYNGKISSKALPEEYVGLSFNNEQENVVKWLY